MADVLMTLWFVGIATFVLYRVYVEGWNRGYSRCESGLGKLTSQGLMPTLAMGGIMFDKIEHVEKMNQCIGDEVYMSKFTSPTGCAIQFQILQEPSPERVSWAQPDVD